MRAKRAYLVHISSSVVNSAARRLTPKARRRRSRSRCEVGLPCVVLRPTLMFGWFDRKHLGWLARFMQRMPVFPIPGTAAICASRFMPATSATSSWPASSAARPATLQHLRPGDDRLHRSDPRREATRCSARAPIVRIPYRLFWAMLCSLWPVRPGSAVHDQAARGAGDAGRVRGHRLAGHLRGEGHAARRRRWRETFQHPDYSQDRAGVLDA